MDGNGRRLLLVLIVLATVFIVRRVGRTREERASRAREEERLTLGDVVPSESDHRETLLDTAVEDSFPASDPPAYWGRATAG